MNQNKLPKCILALSWRDIRFSFMGGAETFTHEMLKRAASRGIEIIHFAPEQPGLPKEEKIDNVHYIRKGSLLSVIFYARKYYRKRRDDIDYVIDQCNTFRFFTKFWVPKRKRIFLIFQLTREIWDINMPNIWGKLGKLLETPMLKLNRKDITITESQSTKLDLLDVGFQKDKVFVIPVGLQKDFLDHSVDFQKKKAPNLIYVGRYSKYKGIDSTLKAFAVLKQDYPDAKLWIVGKKDVSILEELLLPICREKNLSIGDGEENDVVIWGFVSEEQKLFLQESAKVLVFPSIREGWGMIMTEAGAVGTPSITFDAPGTRDAVDFGNAGYLCKENTVEALAECMKEVFSDEDKYCKMQKKAWEFANGFTFDNTGDKFIELLLILHSESKEN